MIYHLSIIFNNINLKKIVSLLLAYTSKQTANKLILIKKIKNHKKLKDKLSINFKK
jgi:hypothetical protein